MECMQDTIRSMNRSSLFEMIVYQITNKFLNQIFGYINTLDSINILDSSFFMKLRLFWDFGANLDFFESL